MAKADLVKRLASQATDLLSKASPGAKQKALDYLSAATGGKVDSITAAQPFGGQNSGTVAVLTRAAVGAGIDPSRIFTGAIMQGMIDSDLLQLQQSLMTEFNNTYGAVDAQSALKGASAQSRARERLLAGAMERVRIMFGGDGMTDRRLQELHVSLKLFISCDEAEISALLADKAAFNTRGAF